MQRGRYAGSSWVGAGDRVVADLTCRRLGPVGRRLGGLVGRGAAKGRTRFGAGGAHRQLDQAASDTILPVGSGPRRPRELPRHAAVPGRLSTPVERHLSSPAAAVWDNRPLHRRQDPNPLGPLRLPCGDPAVSRSLPAKLHPTLPLHPRAPFPEQMPTRLLPGRDGQVLSVRIPPRFRPDALRSLALALASELGSPPLRDCPPRSSKPKELRPQSESAQRRICAIAGSSRVAR